MEILVSLISVFVWTAIVAVVAPALLALIVVPTMVVLS